MGGPPHTEAGRHRQVGQPAQSTPPNARRCTTHIPVPTCQSPRECLAGVVHLSRQRGHCIPVVQVPASAAAAAAACQAKSTRPPGTPAPRCPRPRPFPPPPPPPAQPPLRLLTRTCCSGGKPAVQKLQVGRQGGRGQGGAAAAAAGGRGGGEGTAEAPSAVGTACMQLWGGCQKRRPPPHMFRKGSHCTEPQSDWSQLEGFTCGTPAGGNARAAAAARSVPASRGHAHPRAAPAAPAQPR